MSVKVKVVTKATAANDIGDALEEALETMGTGIVNRARRTAPVDSGDLRRDIHKVVTRRGANVTLEVGSDLDYSGLVEQGTSKMAAQPYLKPALYQTRGVK